MLILASASMALLVPFFAALFSSRVWRHVPLLVAGAILAPGRRMVSSVLRVVGWDPPTTFQSDPRVLNRAVWSSLGASRILFGLLVNTFAPVGPLVVGIDETIAGRRGKEIGASGISRDPVRSSHRHFVKVRGLRWICATLLVPIPWAHRVWALPFPTVLAPSERAAAQRRRRRRRRRRFKPLTTWARRMIVRAHRWAPARPLVVVGDRAYAALELLAAVREGAAVIARLRPDARLLTPPPPRMPGRKGRPRLVGDRLPNRTAHATDAAAVWSQLTLPRWYGERDRPIEALSQKRRADGGVVLHRLPTGPDPLGAHPRPTRRVPRPGAALCTDLDAEPQQIVSWCILRWQLEVTCHEVRAHLGVETQRQWSERAILRTTPTLLGLFSLVTLLSHARMPAAESVTRQAAWYTKATPTFVDALALVRRHLWAQVIFQTALPDTDPVKLPRALLDRLSDLLCYAA